MKQHDPSPIRARVIVSGRVQGVCFRAATQETARAHGVTGWVKNLPDGRVEAVFEGPEDAVNAVIAWCHTGPPAAIVKNVAVTREEYTGAFDRFSIAW
ncbi:MAG: acylphosphatase [Desulfobacterota bacterium]|nr:acylphosphatase [Thermodesulfobacteriota bacterium]